MKVYRVRYFTEGGSSAGFSFHTSLEGALRAARTYQNKLPDEQEPKIEARNFPLTKQGMMTALATWGSHAENG